jgi:WD40 repeat protein
MAVGDAAGAVRVGQAAVAPVTTLVTYADGDDRWWVVSAGAGTVTRWEVQAGPGSATVMHAGSEEWDEVDALAVAGPTGGERVIVGLRGRDGMLRWQAETGQLLGEQLERREWPLWWARRGAPAAQPPVTAVELGGRSFVVTAMTDHSLRLSDTATGTLVGRPWVGHSDLVWSMASAVLADGTPLACSGARDDLVRRWDARTGEEYGPPLLYRRPVALAMAPLPDGRTVVCIGTAKGNVYRCDAATGERLGPAVPAGGRPTGDEPVATAQYAHARVACLPTAEGGLLVTSVAGARTVQCWDLTSGQHLAALDPGTQVSGLAAARLADGTPVVVVNNGTGRLYRLNPLTGAPMGEPVAPYGVAAGSVCPIHLDQERVVLAVSTSTGLYRFDAATGQALGDAHQPIPVRGYGRAVAALPDQRTLLVMGGEDGITRLDLDTGDVYEQGPDERPFTIWDVASLPLPDGRVMIAGAGHDSLVYRWDAATGEAIGEPLDGHTVSVKAIVTTTDPDGTPMIISASEGGQILRWHALTGQRIGQPLRGRMAMGGDLALLHHDDGRQVLILVSFDHPVQQWDPVTGRRAGPSFTPGDWALLIAADIDPHGVPTVVLDIVDRSYKTLRVEQWRLDTGTKVRELPTNLCAAYRAHGVLTMVLTHEDGSLSITPLPELEHQQDQPQQG